MLVRRGGKHAGPDERHWFLFKERDEFAKPAVDIVAKQPLSVTTGRDLNEIAEQATRVWGPDGEVSQNGRGKQAARKAPSRSRSRAMHGRAATNARKTSAKLRAPQHTTKLSPADKAAITSALKKLKAKRGALPATASVQLAALAKDAPEGDDWIHEVKFDGYRMLCRIDHRKVRFISRNGHDWTSKLPALAAAASALPVTTAILDGEVVVMQPDGTTSFQALQNAFQSGGESHFLFYGFDLLYVDGWDLRSAPIEDRKDVLRRIIPDDADGPFRYSDHVVGNGAKVFAEASRFTWRGLSPSDSVGPIAPVAAGIG